MRKQNNADEILRMLRCGERPKDIAQACGCTTTTVYKYAEQNGIELRFREIQKDKREKAETMFRDGMSVKSICKELGICKETARKIRSDVGVPVFVNQYGDYSQRLQRAVENIERRLPGFEYVSGFTGCDDKITIRCKECGEEKTISGCKVRSKKRTVCKRCSERERERLINQQAAREEWAVAVAEAEREWTSEYRKALSDFERERKLIEKQRPCIDCGKPVGRRSEICIECAKRRENHNREVIRRNKIRDALVDRDINLTVLYEKQDGRCYICGCKCDWNDKEERNGTIVTGNTYPSIDHVIPLSLGGLHSWDNVRCACRMCNSQKRDKITERGTPHLESA